MRGGRVGGFAYLAALLTACGSSPASPDAAATVDALDAAGAIDALDASPDATAPPAALTLTSTGDSFGYVGVGTTSAPITVTATNTGGSPTAALATAILATPMQFVIGADTCNGIALAAGSSCTLQVRFMPNQAGATVATVRVGDGTVSATRELNGTAIFSDDINTVSPSLHDYGDVPIGMTTAPMMFTVTNIGGTTHGPIAMMLAGADPSAFTVVADSCSGTSLAPGTTCTFGVTFTPHASGIATAYVQMTANPGGTASATVRGTGFDPALRVDLSSRDFGSVPVAAQSQYARFVVTNAGTAATAPLTTTISGMHPNDFTIAAGTNTCAAAALAPGATCAVEVRFEPTAVQHRYARLVVAAPASAAIVDLTGDAGAANGLEINPTPFSFGDVPVGQASTPRTFTITNHGNALTLGPIFSSSPVFVVSADTCSNVMLAQNASCSFDVTAHPTALGFVAYDVGTFAYSGMLVRGVP